MESLHPVRISVPCERVLGECKGGYWNGSRPPFGYATVVNGPTMLAGVARCAHCDAAMIFNTGKGIFRYYACSRAMKQGKTACQGQRMRMDRLDDLVLDYLTSRIFEPHRLSEMLKTYMEAHEAGAAARKGRLRQLRDRLGEVQAARTRLLTLAEDPSLKERLLQLKMQASDLDAESAGLQASLANGTPTITRERIDVLVTQMRERFRAGPPELRQVYIRLLLEKWRWGRVSSPSAAPTPSWSASPPMGRLLLRPKFSLLL